MDLVISSGHGLKVRGASGYLDEVDEARRVVDRVAEILDEEGHGIKTFHDDVSVSQDENLRRITDYHNAQERELDVSVHFNAYETTSKPMGTECLYVSQKDLAGEMATAIATASGLPNRGPKKRTDLFFLNNTEEPAILIEVVFVDSKADADAYDEHFEDICLAIAGALVDEELEPDQPVPPRPEPPDEVVFQVRGKCSHFGGPDDTGVSPSEGLAFIYDYDEARHLFLPEQPPDTTGLARRLNTGVFYVACRWDYDVTSKIALANPSVQALVRAGDKQFLAWPADWGPNENTGRVADLSPALMDALGLDTDDEVEVIYPAPIEQW